MMNEGIREIIAEGIRRDACGRIREIDSWEKAVSMLLSPQGREFAVRTGFPTLAAFRGNAAALSAVPGVFVDSGRALAANMDCVAAGDTDLTASFRNPGRLYHVVAMHGARVTVDARNHAVVTAAVADGFIDIKGDGTAAVTIERENG